MPELPEVETTLRGLEPHITGKIKGFSLIEIVVGLAILTFSALTLLHNQWQSLQRLNNLINQAYHAPQSEREIARRICSLQKAMG